MRHYKTEEKTDFFANEGVSCVPSCAVMAMD